MQPSTDDIRRAAKAELCRRSLAYFVEATSGYQLHSWQLLLCERLGRLKDQKGQRLLIHAPPQVGKSQIVSKRLPLWMIGQNKLTRVIIAAYNKTQAGTFVESNKLVASNEYAKSAFAIDWVRFSADDGGYTRERQQLADAQPSLIGVGLDSGFTGKNADLLIIDDPYPNAEHARSEAYNRAVRSFWEETAEPRLMANPEANVVVMFHRYHENDIAGYLKTRSDWEELTFPAIYRGQANDPTGREVGDVLSPFLNIETLLKKEAEDPKTFAGQFQGEPLADGEKPGEAWMLEDRVRDVRLCPMLKEWYRGIDTAIEDKAHNDFTATAKLAFDEYGDLHIRGFKMIRKNIAQLTEWVGDIAEQDGRHVTWIPELHNMGYAVYDHLKRRGYPVYGQKIGSAQGSKKNRALSLYDLAYRRKVYIYKEGDYEAFINQFLSFTGDPKLNERDDLIDSVTVVLTYLKENKSAEKIQRRYRPVIDNFDPGD